MGDQFPTDVIYGILSRLPIKSLARFRCVCKSWLKYINDPYLQTIHAKEEPTPIIFQRVDPCAGFKNRLCKISFLRVTQGGTMSVKKDHVLDVPYRSWYSTQPDLVLGSCNGLTLVCYSYIDGPLLTLINPLTKKRHDLPPVKLRPTHWDRPGSLEAAGICFDNSTNTLTTVCLIRFWSTSGFINAQPCVMVHHSGMGWWQEVADQNPAYPISGEGLFAHGRLHWLASRNDNSYNDGRIIMWFDVKTKEFGLTDVPGPTRSGQTDDYFDVDDEQQLVELNGEIGFAYMDMVDNILLWILKQEEWVLLCQLDPKLRSYIDMEVSGCWNNDGDILLTAYGGRQLFVYTLKTGELKQVDRSGLCEADIRMHRSSFFSIRGINI